MMTLVGVERRPASADEQNVEVAAPEFLQDFVQVGCVSVALWRRDDALIVHRLALEKVISVLQAHVPAAVELALLQRTGVGTASGKRRRLDWRIEAVVLPRNEVLCFFNLQSNFFKLKLLAISENVS